MRGVSCYVYNRIPGAWEKWTLAVFAVGRRDADTYVKAVNRGGTFVGEVKGGTVKADCGATTEAAQEAIRAQNERLI